METPASLETLPDELWMMVLSFLDGDAMVALTRTCHFTRRLTAEPLPQQVIATHKRVYRFLRERRAHMARFYGADYTPRANVFYVPPAGSLGPIKNPPPTKPSKSTDGDGEASPAWGKARKPC